MNMRISTPVLLLAGVLVGWSLSYFPGMSGEQENQDSEQASGGADAAGAKSREPLYWVAPMDPDFRRDKPGKSPMGMDLVPVYPQRNQSLDSEPGAVRISPAVVNNLGVKSAVASRELWRSRIDTVGYVKYDEDRLVHIHPRVKGWIETLYVKAAGDPVAAGQPLYEIYAPELVNAQNELVLALERSNSKLIEASEYRLAALQLPQSAIDTLTETRQVQQTVTFYAPQQGVVDNLNIREGFYVQPDTMLMSIGDLSEVWVEAEVFERQAPLVEEGARVTMQLGYLPGKTWQGRVDYIHPVLDEQTRTLKIRLRFPNEGLELRPNMFAQVSIFSESGAPALIVPRASIIRTGTMDRVVLDLGEGRFKAVKVLLGRVSGEQAEILAGVDEGDRVVISAQFLLDSESSKSADFERMSDESDGAMQQGGMTEAEL